MGGYNKHAIAITAAFVLSLISVIYTKLMPPDLLPWKTANLPWHIEYIFQAMFYMVLGYIFRGQFEKTFDKFNNAKCSRFIIGFVYLIIAFLPYVLKLNMTTVVDIGYLYLSQLLGIIAIIAFSKKIKSNAYIRYIGQNTLICFALHGKVYSVLQTIMKKTIPNIYEAVLANVVASSVVSLLLALLISVILIVPIYVINRWIPFIVGRKKAKDVIC